MNDIWNLSNMVNIFLVSGRGLSMPSSLPYQ